MCFWYSALLPWFSHNGLLFAMQLSYGRIKKIPRKFGSVQRAVFAGILRVLMSDTFRDQTCLSINKTGVGKRQSADQVQAAYVGSVFNPLFS